MALRFPGTVSSITHKGSTYAIKNGLPVGASAAHLTDFRTLGLMVSDVLPGEGVYDVRLLNGRAGLAGQIPRIIFDTETGNLRTLWQDELVAIELFTAAGPTTALATASPLGVTRAPFAGRIVDWRFSLNVAASAAAPTFDITAGGTTIFGATKPAIDIGAKTSVGSAVVPTLAVLSIADDAELVVNCTVAGTGAQGLRAVLLIARS